MQKKNISEDKDIAINYLKCRIEKKRKSKCLEKIVLVKCWTIWRNFVIGVTEGRREWIFEEIMINIIFFQIWWEVYSRFQKLSEAQEIYIYITNKIMPRHKFKNCCIMRYPKG